MKNLSSKQLSFILMVTAMCCLPGMDAMAKYLSQTMPVMQVIWFRYLGQFLVVLCILSSKLKASAATDNLCLATALLFHPAPTLFRLHKFILRRAGASLYSSWVMETNWLSKAERFTALKRLTSFVFTVPPLMFGISLRTFRLRRKKFFSYV